MNIYIYVHVHVDMSEKSVTIVTCHMNIISYIISYVATQYHNITLHCSKYSTHTRTVISSYYIRYIYIYVCVCIYIYIGGVGRSSSSSSSYSFFVHVLLLFIINSFFLFCPPHIITFNILSYPDTY